MLSVRTRLHIPSIERMANNRGQPFFDAVLEAGRRDGAVLEIDEDKFNAILKAHPRAGSHAIKGLGDIVERIAKPIAKVFNLPCLDENKNLKPESPCAKRRDWMNQEFPIKR